mmetsp:Transcript_16613/g.46376  ORF Transcript_16613/g.46376 Transcript_16613/m.46376 type:complete len:87 (-) Transcript_16613:54-314(-)
MVLSLEQWSNPEWEVYVLYGPPGEDWPVFRPATGEVVVAQPSGQRRANNRIDQCAAAKKMRKAEVLARKVEIEKGRRVKGEPFPFM